ncbi:outer mitochondrial transmembrane helix translocase [Octopus bimaculoides]|nr:outer mitochondrial transmembrane helix translocase [Octopus bimaculoides]|eukprot:XP_014790306.1 PREDICTED: ATPase family AAA domain-containing protein 1-like [Octopus bimaculoides]
MINIVCEAMTNSLLFAPGKMCEEVTPALKNVSTKSLWKAGDGPVSSIFAKLISKLESSTGLKAEHIFIKVVATCCSFAAVYVTFSWILKKMDPTYEEKKKAQIQAKVMLKRLGIDEHALNEYEVAVAANLVDPRCFDISWEQIGGLDNVKKELKQTVIFPLKNFTLLDNSKLMKPPRGVLLYGPPGCGKTMIAKATAKASGANFLFVELSSMLDKWYGESQKRVAAIFNLAHKIQPTIIFIDEIDSLLRTRNTQDHEATSMMKTQFMNYWDGLLTDSKSQVIIIGATNNRQALDQAILRRMPCQLYVGNPSTDQRYHILEIILSDEVLGPDVDLSVIAQITDGFSGSDLHEVCRLAASVRISEYIDTTSADNKEGSEPSSPILLLPMSSCSSAQPETGAPTDKGCDSNKPDKLENLRGISQTDLCTGVDKVQSNISKLFC